MDCIVHGVEKSWTRPSDFHFHCCSCQDYALWLKTQRRAKQTPTCPHGAGYLISLSPIFQICKMGSTPHPLGTAWGFTEKMSMEAICKFERSQLKQVWNSTVILVCGLPCSSPFRSSTQVILIACVLSLQLCLTLCNPMDCSPAGSSVHGSLQARILEWVAMLHSGRTSRPRDQNCISCTSCIAGGFFTAEPPGKPLCSLGLWNLVHIPLHAVYTTCSNHPESESEYNVDHLHSPYGVSS